MPTRRELQEENATLRENLRDLQDQIAEILAETDEDDEPESDEGEEEDDD